MNKNRLEAFSDGVIAIIITIMVLELKLPQGGTWSDLKPLIPTLLSYVLSFLFIAIYWGQHHHMLHTVKKVGPGIIWSNMALLFSLSLIPFSTAWMGENHFSRDTVVCYAILQNMCGLSYYILQQVIIRQHDFNEKQKEAYKKQERRGILSLILFVTSVFVAYIDPIFSEIIFVITVGMWLIPDRNIQNAFTEH